MNNLTDILIQKILTELFIKILTSLKQRSEIIDARFKDGLRE